MQKPERSKHKVLRTTLVGIYGVTANLDRSVQVYTSQTIESLAIHLRAFLIILIHQEKESMTSSGLPSSRKMRSYWRESSGGL